MPPSPWSNNGILTIVSLLTLCIISFIVIFGSDSIVDTQPVRDIVYSFPKRNLYTPRHRRSLHHNHNGRAPAVLPRASAPAGSNNGQSNSPQTNPTAQSQAFPSQSNQASQDSNTQPQSPSPSPSPESQSQAQFPASSSSPPSSKSHVTQASPANPTSSSASPAPASAPTSATPASAQQSASTSNANAVSNTASRSSNIFALPTVTYLSTTSNLGDFPNPTAAKSVVSAGPTAGATEKGFFANKAAVGVVFGIVGLVVALAAMMGGRMILGRYRNARDAREVDDFFEKYSAGGHTIDDDHHHGGASTPTDVMTHAAPDAYPDRSFHYGSRSGGSADALPLSMDDFGIPYPPTAAGASVQHSVPSPEHPFASSVNASYPTGAPPVTYPRDPAYADPYYGYDATGGDPVNMGYAH